jgi:hypothetical protein
VTAWGTRPIIQAIPLKNSITVFKSVNKKKKSVVAAGAACRNHYSALPNLVDKSLSASLEESR